jgi:spore germination protein GerM
VAYVDFNENFRFNPLGKEGLKAQLNQVVYTVTEFSNISRLQILIDGKKVNFLGPEGIYIGEPLSRSSLVASE